MGPWNVSDYLFPSLVEHGKNFLGLGVRQDSPGNRSLQREDSEYSMRAMDKSGRYSAISYDISTEPMSQQRGRH